MYKIEGMFFINGIELIDNIDVGISKDLGSALNLKSKTIVYIKEVEREKEYLFSDDKEGKINPVTIKVDEEGVSYFPIERGLSPLLISEGFAIGLTELK